MKKLLLIGALCISAISFSYAQGQGQQQPPEVRAQTYIDAPLLAGLNLTADQKTKALAILTAQNKSVDSLMTTLNGDFQALAPKRLPIAEANEKKFIALLTDDQKKAYATAVTAAKATNPNTYFGGGRRGGGGGGQGGAPAGAPPAPRPAGQ